MKSYDLIVAGGGPSGVMAALSASRLGLHVLMIERHGFLGGMNTAALVGPIMTFHAGKTQIVRGIAGSIMDELKLRGGTPGHLVDPIWANTSMTPVDTEAYKALLIEEVLKSKLELLLHTTVIGGKRSGEQIEELTISNKAGLQNLRAKFFIDATGDGDLAAALGCDFLMGRADDALTQPMTLMFKMAGVDESAVRAEIRANPENFYLGFPIEEYLALPGLAVSGFFEQVKRGKKEGAFPIDRDRVLFFGLVRKGEVTVNSLRMSHVNGTIPEDLTRAEMTLRSQVAPLAKFLKAYIPGFKDAYVFETAAQVGVRETRHIVGDYTLTTENVLKQTQFDDVIAHASYPIDIHSPDGSGMKIVDPRRDRPESYYDIPLRALLPKGTRNLIVSGRCISAEHEASASSRISATCMALGQAAGSAVYQTLQAGRQCVREVDVSALQKLLVAQQAFLTTAKR